MTYRGKMGPSGPPVPSDNTDMLRVLGLNKPSDAVESYATTLQFSNYGDESTWQIDYVLECNFAAETIRCIAGSCKKIR